MASTLLANASVLDGRAEASLAAHRVLVEDGAIREVPDRPLTWSSARRLDLRGRTPMPALIEAPRLVICGEALSQFGGHTDYRGPHHARDVGHRRDRAGSLGRVVDQVRRACGEAIEGGAAIIAVMARGGVSVPTDPLADLALLTGQGRHMPAIMEGGRFKKDGLAA